MLTDTLTKPLQGALFRRFAMCAEFDLRDIQEGCHDFDEIAKK
jgi:hypothetical protein